MAKTYNYRAARAHRGGTIKVIIPLAGRGTRMRPHTHTKPKPLLPVAGKPVLDHVMDAVQKLNPTQYIFITGHLKEHIEEHIAENYDISAQFIEQAAMDGTAGAVRLAKDYVDEPVLIVFVDTVFDADLSIAKQTTDDGIIWAQEVEDYQRFGVIVHDEQHHMTQMVEKPTEPVSKLANIGLYYIRNYQLLFEGIEHLYAKDITGQGEYWLTDAFQYMIDKGAKLNVAEVDGWYDCGKPETTLESNAALLPSHHEIKSVPQETVINEPVYIGEGCDITGCVIGPNVSIGNNCILRNTVISNAIIDHDSVVENITLHDSILGENTRLEGQSKERKASVLLGDHSETKLG